MDMDPLDTDTRKKNRPSMGIAFGGGAARGFCHLGVLEALFEDLEIKLAIVATEIEKTSLIDMNRRDTLMGLGKAAMQV